MAAMQTVAARLDRGPARHLAAIVIAALLPGCSNQSVYHAAKLPPEFLAAGVENVRTADLSRLTSQVVSSNQIGPGDLLEVTIETGYDQRDSAVPVRVGDDGLATIPLLGQLPLSGLELETAERLIAATAIERGVYRNPSVTVDMKRQRTNRVTVIGAVENPDVYELPRGSSTLLAALVAAGGLTAEAATSVEIRHPGVTPGRRHPPVDRVTAAGFQPDAPSAQPVSYQVDLVAAAKQEHPGFTLADGDIVMVQRRDPQPFDVLGMVNKPGRFELPANKDLYVLDAIALAGGVSTQWADKAHLIRHLPDHKEPVVIEISLKSAKREGVGNLRLAPGDVVSIEQTPMTMMTGGLRAIAPYSVTAIVPFIK